MESGRVKRISNTIDCRPGLHFLKVGRCTTPGEPVTQAIYVRSVNIFEV
jgi:hypothetical protein